MHAPSLHERHAGFNARFIPSKAHSAIAHYGDTAAEHQHLTRRAALIDLSSRGRLGIVGADRQRFLNGQVASNIARLQPGQGAYAVLVSPKGRIDGDFWTLVSRDELVLDLEPHATHDVQARLERYIIADDVEVVDVTEAYGLLSVQGPASPQILQDWTGLPAVPQNPGDNIAWNHPDWGEVLVVRLPRTHADGWEVLAPAEHLAAAFDDLLERVTRAGGGPAGLDALETARIESGIPRFGTDMTPEDLVPEADLEAVAVDYHKGCYIGQEVISRIRTYGRVRRQLRALRLPAGLDPLPAPGTPLLDGERKAGNLTSVAFSPEAGFPVALGYVGKEFLEPGSRLHLPDHPEPVLVAAPTRVHVRNWSDLTGGGPRS